MYNPRGISNCRTPREKPPENETSSPNHNKSTADCDNNTARSHLSIRLCQTNAAANETPSIEVNTRTGFMPEVTRMLLWLLLK